MSKMTRTYAEDRAHEDPQACLDDGVALPTCRSRSRTPSPLRSRWTSSAANRSPPHLRRGRYRINRVWSLLSADDEWIARVWMDQRGRYHVARDLDENGRLIEASHTTKATQH
jgi:hypothetical protein